MSGAEVSLGRRKVIKTAAIAEFDQIIKKSASTREVMARNKKVRAQLGALGEEEDDEDEGEEEAKKPVKKKVKGKGKASDSTSSSSKANSEKNKAVSQEEVNVAEVVRDEARRNMLIQLFHYRDNYPLNELNVLDLDELEKMWSKGEASKAVPGKAPATKVPAKPKPKAPAKTPAKKVSAALPKESSIEWLGSPAEALLRAKSQSERAAAPSPLAKSRKRDLSTGPDGNAKRPRTKLIAQLSKPAVVSKPNKPVTKSADDIEKKTASSRSTEREADGEEIDIEVALDGMSKDGVQTEDVKPWRKKESTDRKNRPKSSEYHGVERQILDQAVLETLRILAERDLCPGPAEYELYLEEGWDMAVMRRRQDSECWPMTKDHGTCIKQRINSWRGHANGRVLAGIEGAYNLGPSNTSEDVKAHIAELGEKEFHRNRKNGSKGNYTAPYISQAIYHLFYVGRIPIATHFKGEFKVIPLPAIAYAAGLIETFINCYRTGTFSKPKRIGVGELTPSVEKHYNNLVRLNDKTPSVCLNMQEDTAAAAAALVGEVVQVSRCKSAPGVLSEDDFDTVDLTPEELARNRNARSALPAFKKPQPTVEPSSGDESDAMNVDDVEGGRPLAPVADSGDELESLAASEVVRKVYKNNGRPYVPLGDSDAEMDDAPVGEKGKSKEESSGEDLSGGESGSDAEADNGGPSFATSVDKVMAGGGRVAEGGVDEEGKQDKEGEVEDEEEGESRNGDRPAGGEVSGSAQQVRNKQDSDLTDLGESDGEAVPVDNQVEHPMNSGTGSKTASRMEKVAAAGGKDMDEQPPATRKAPAQDIARQVRTRDASSTPDVNKERDAKRMKAAIADIAARQEARRKAAAAKAEEEKAAAKADRANKAAVRKGLAKEVAAQEEMVEDEAVVTKAAGGKRAKGKRGGGLKKNN